jgi:hypothetical protein
MLYVFRKNNFSVLAVTIVVLAATSRSDAGPLSFNRTGGSPVAVNALAELIIEYPPLIFPNYTLLPNHSESTVDVVSAAAGSIFNLCPTLSSRSGVSNGFAGNALYAYAKSASLGRSSFSDTNNPSNWITPGAAESGNASAGGGGLGGSAAQSNNASAGGGGLGGFGDFGNRPDTPLVPGGGILGPGGTGDDPGTPVVPRTPDPDVSGVDDVPIPPDAATRDQVENPEPASLTLIGIGIAGMAGYAWRRKKRQAKR